MCYQKSTSYHAKAQYDRFVTIDRQGINTMEAMELIRDMAGNTGYLIR